MLFNVIKMELTLNNALKEYNISNMIVFIQLSIYLDYLLESGTIADDDCKLDKHLSGASKDFLDF